ncbi:MAG: hypothetical protein RLY86_645 [Pseudomonadota bacterium]
MAGTSFGTSAEQDIADFWQHHPCGESLVDADPADAQAFFDAYDRMRYRLEAHIPACLDAIGFKGRRTLEIGLGQGADSEQIIRRGAIWSGIDLTEAAAARVRRRLTLRDLPHEQIVVGSALNLPFPAASQDIVYSHGVLHHIPDIRTAQSEIHRVLRPGGLLVAMLYARWSLNYLLAIAVLRRLGLLALLVSGRRPGGIYDHHVDQAKREGWHHYLRLRRFIHANTDGPDNPYSKVYDLHRVSEDFPDFTIAKSYKRFMHAPPLPVHGLPGGSIMGWHLWVHLTPRRR